MATVAVVIAAGGGIAFATIPDSAGVIHGCYLKAPGAGGIAKGTLRVIDTDASENCTASENSLDWNQTGPQGPPGAQGSQGPQGAQGTQGTIGTANGGPISNVPPLVAHKPKSYKARTVSEKLLWFTTNNTDIGCAATGKGSNGGGECAKTARVSCPASYPFVVGHSVNVTRGTLSADVSATGGFLVDGYGAQQQYWEPNFSPTPDQVSETDPRTPWVTPGNWGLPLAYGYGQPTSLSLTPKLASFDFRLRIVCAKEHRA
jgi:hypothetical protein